MRSFVFFIIIFISAKLRSQDVQQIELVFKYPCAVCNEKDSAQGTDQKPAKLTTFYVYKDKRCTDTISTDENGVVLFDLVDGEYLLFEGWKQHRQTPDGSEFTGYYEDCLKAAWEKPNYRIRINNAEVNLTYFELDAAYCPNQYPCLKVKHEPGKILRQQ